MPTTAQRPRILLVDDNADNQALMRLFLDGPYRTDCAANGREAVDLFAATPYDLVFMDLEMPVMDGYEATRAMRALERGRPGPPVPILALTAYSQDEFRLRCEAAGCTDFLVKPVGKALVQDTVARHLGENAAWTRPAPQPPVPLRVADGPDRDMLRPLLPLFFATAGETLDTARRALEAEDLEVVRAQGHKLRGAALSYGFADLGQAAGTLEQAGGQGDAAAAATCMALARELLARAKRGFAG
uniref:Response regulator containing CheY-like receiver domain and AraC-type DNA-binding domain n=1 Tax=Desulfovibrio sp. U5L TaxID=596152 RepID=I2Q655_9BACT